MENIYSNNSGNAPEKELSAEKSVEKIEQKQQEVTTQLYKDELRKFAAKNVYLRTLVNQLTKNQISVRDQIAQAIYIQLYKEVPSAREAAIDAYEAADIFLRVREDELSVVNDLRAFVQNHPNDSELGQKMRSMFGSKINKTETNE